MTNVTSWDFDVMRNTGYKPEFCKFAIFSVLIVNWGLFGMAINTSGIYLFVIFICLHTRDYKALKISRDSLVT